jgi:hypothetical protein
MAPAIGRLPQVSSQDDSYVHERLIVVRVVLV